MGVCQRVPMEVYAKVKSGVGKQCAETAGDHTGPLVWPPAAGDPRVVWPRQKIKLAAADFCIKFMELESGEPGRPHEHSTVSRLAFEVVDHCPPICTAWWAHVLSLRPVVDDLIERGARTSEF